MFNKLRHLFWYNFVLEWVRDVVSDMVFVYEWHWVENVITFICNLEMKVRACLVGRKVSMDIEKIPEGIYCYEGFMNVCPYWSFSYIARFLYGDQCSGYCYFLKDGDYSSSTDILWDMCKCCGIKDEEDFEESEVEELECNLEL